MFDALAAIKYARAGLGAKYGYGSKWDVKAESPGGPVDCSGFARFVLYKGGATTCPDGTAAQYLDSYDVDEPQTCDMKFMFGDKGQTTHVVLLKDKDTVIESRGEPYNKVIERPRAKWDAQEHTSSWRRPKSIDRANGVEETVKPNAS